MQALSFRPRRAARGNCFSLRPGASRRGFTLVEILVAAALALLLMAGTVTLFGMVSESISESQAFTETADRLRATQMVLQNDLKYSTLIGHAVPPIAPRDERGYFEYVEGPGPSFNISGGSIVRDFGLQPVNSLDGIAPDTSVGDVDDFLLFTARSYGEPYVGRFAFFNAATNQVETTTIQSQIAEVAWFLRGTTLYRRVLLVQPNGPDADSSTPEKEPVLTMGLGSSYPDASFYSLNDVSVHQEGGSLEPRLGWPQAGFLVPNSLGDLSRREFRFAHDPVRQPGHYPYLVAPNAGLGVAPNLQWWGQMALPTLEECSDATWRLPHYGNNPVDPSNLVSPVASMDFWLAPNAWPQIDPESNSLGPNQVSILNNFPVERIAQDVILQNVISFDVKIWDPNAPVFVDSGIAIAPGDPGYRTALQDWINNGAPLTGSNAPASLGAYVDLFYARGLSVPNNVSLSPLAGPGDVRSGLMADNSGLGTPATYDTWTTHYESDGLDQDNDGAIDEGTDGVDNNGVGGVDDPTEHETAPPYNGTLKSIQIKLRVFEPGSRQIREVTVVQDFVS